MSEETSAQPAQSADEFGLDAVRELLGMIHQSDITEILIERGDIKLHVKRGSAAPPPSMMPAAPFALSLPSLTPAGTVPAAAPVATAMGNSQSAGAAGAAEAPAELPKGQTVTAPMVGTFYAAPSPKDPPFIQEGDEVRSGDTVGIIEAMKMMNEIECEFSGRVAKVMVKNGQPVEYGQPILIVEPL